MPYKDPEKERASKRESARRQRAIEQQLLDSIPSYGKGGYNNTKHDNDPQVWLIARIGPTKAKRILKAIEAYFAIVRVRQAPKAS